MPPPPCPNSPIVLLPMTDAYMEQKNLVVNVNSLEHSDEKIKEDEIAHYEVYGVHQW